MNKSLKLAFVAGTVLFVVPSSYSMLGRSLRSVANKVSRISVRNFASGNKINPTKNSQVTQITIVEPKTKKNIPSKYKINTQRYQVHDTVNNQHLGSIERTITDDTVTTKINIPNINEIQLYHIKNLQKETTIQLANNNMKSKTTRTDSDGFLNTMEEVHNKQLKLEAYATFAAVLKSLLPNYFNKNT